MIRILAALVISIYSACCRASGGDVRPLKDVFSEAGVILYGAVVGSGIGECGGKNGVNSFYILRVTGVAKGEVRKGDIRVCGSAPMLLGNQYLIAGDKYKNDEITFAPDAVFLVFPTDEYYRLISYDGPIVDSDRGIAYAIGVLEPDFIKCYGDMVKVKTP